jgi:hypothetical protein
MQQPGRVLRVESGGIALAGRKESQPSCRPSQLASRLGARGLAFAARFGERLDAGEPARLAAWWRYFLLERSGDTWTIVDDVITRIS